MTILTPKPLTREGFAPFGDVIEADESRSFLINEGTTRRYHRLAHVDVAGEGGQPILSIFRGDRRAFPLMINMVEQHPKGSQAFIPMTRDPWLVVVAANVRKPTPSDCHAFLARGDQGVQYARGTWHHPLLILKPRQDFLVVDRYSETDKADDNLIECWFDGDHARVVIDPID